MSVFYNRREMRAGWRFCIFFLAVFCVSVLLSRALHALHLTIHSDVANILVRESLALIVILLPMLLMSRLEGRSFDAYALPVRQAFGGLFWHGAVAGFAALSVLLLTLRLFGNFYFGQRVLHGGEVARFAFTWAVAFLFVGLVEELLMRGYSLFVLSQGMGFWPAALVLSILFAALHVQNDGESKVGIFAVFVVGMVFCYMVLRTGSLWFAIGFHAAWDWSQSFLYGVPDSGQKMQGHLMEPSFAGSKWMTGGTVGPEGSLLIFVVLALVTLYVHWRFPSDVYDADAFPPAPGAPLSVKGTSAPADLATI